MGLFDRGGSYRLRDHEEKKPKEVRRYKPPKPLSWLSCALVILFALLLFGYGASLLTMRFAGTRTDALANTRLTADGEIEQIELTNIVTTITYTYRDQNGTLRQSTDSLIGNEEEFHETIPVVYFAPIPGWSMLAFRTEDILTPCGSLLLGVVLLSVAIRRLREIYGKTAENAPDD